MSCACFQLLATPSDRQTARRAATSERRNELRNSLDEHDWLRLPGPLAPCIWIDHVEGKKT